MGTFNRNFPNTWVIEKIAVIIYITHYVITYFTVYIAVYIVVHILVMKIVITHFAAT